MHPAGDLLFLFSSFNAGSLGRYAILRFRLPKIATKGQTWGCHPIVTEHWLAISLAMVSNQDFTGVDD
jgi:hypothetical protein